MANILFLVPLGFYVVAFSYETYLSFLRLRKTRAARTGYVHATWEITHTLLVFSLVMLLMLHTANLAALAHVLFMPAFIAAFALTVRAFCYVYIFYVRGIKASTGWIDWLFALSHAVALLTLAITAYRAVDFLRQANLVVNHQFLGYFVPGLGVILAVCALPMIVLYSTKD